MKDRILFILVAAMALTLFMVAPSVALADGLAQEDPLAETVVAEADGADSENAQAVTEREVTSDSSAVEAEGEGVPAPGESATEGEPVPAVPDDVTAGEEPVPATPDSEPATEAEQVETAVEPAAATAAEPEEEPVTVTAQAVTTASSASAAAADSKATTAAASTSKASTEVTVKAASNETTVNPAYTAGFRDGHQYLLTSGLSGSRALTVSGSTVVSGALTRTNDQFWKAVFTDDGFVKFISVSAGKALGVKGGKAANGAKLALYASKNALYQKWSVTKLSDGSYSIVSALSGKTKFVLDIAGASKDNGAAVQLYKSNGTAAQKWKRTDVTSKHATQDKKAKAASMPKGNYAIASDLGNALALTNSNANAQNRTYTGAKAQKWTITVGSDGYATIKASDGRVLDVAGAQAVNGANVQLYASNNTRAQKWIVTKNSDGTYKLESALWPNLVVDVAGAAKKSGTNVQVYASNNSAAQKWDLVKTKASVRASDKVAQGYYILWTSAKKQLCLDVSGGSAADGATLQLYGGNETIAQHFRIVKKGDYYRIEACCAPGKRADFDSGLVVPGTKAQTWNSDSNNSLFSFQKNADGSYRIVNVASGLAMGVAGSAKQGAAVKGTDGIIGKNVNFVLEKRSGLLDEGTYTVNTALAGGRVLAVVDDSWSSGAKLDMETYLKGLSQKWYVKPVSGKTNTYTIESLSSGMRLSGANNARATQSSANGTLQQWVPTVVYGNTVVLKNVSNGKALDVSGASTSEGAAVMNWSANGTAAQNWTLYKVPDVDTGLYEFKLAASTGKSLDVDVASGNVQVWTAGGTANQRWYYDASAKTLKNLETGKVLDVAGGSKASGANVQQYASNGTAAQKWTISYAGSGRFKVTSSLGSTLVLSTAGTGDGANATDATDKGKTTQRWRMKKTMNNKPTGFNLITSIISNGHGSLNPSYVVIHETANPGATAKNHRDYWASNDTYAVHYTLDWTGNCYYCVPEDRKCWQVGNGNAYVVGIELCHATNKSDFNKVWNGGVEWARWQLAKRGWGVDRLISHYECGERWGGTDHTDPIDYFASYGKSWGQFKNEVAKALARGY